jgi:hypothetical protein
MSAVAMGSELEPREIVASRLKLSWGAIFGGVFVALGVWIMLLTLGFAIGLTSVDSDNLSTAKQAATVTGVWSVVALFLSLLAGGMVAARTAGIVDRPTGALHGAVLWGFTTLAGALILGMALRAGVGAAANLGGTALGGAAAAATGVASEADTLTQSLGISGDDLVAPINQRLRMEGKPPVTSRQIEAATKDAVSRGIREGRLDKQVLVSSIANQTNLSSADANDLADRIEMSFNEKRAALGNKVESAVGSAVDTSARAMWWTFFAQLIGLGSAILGASMGVTRKQRIAAHRVAPAAASIVEPPAVISTREVHTHS